MAFSTSFRVHKRLISLLFCVCLFVAVFAVLAGCERSGPPASQSASQSVSQQTNREADAKTVSKPGSGADSEKLEDTVEQVVSCSYDAQCSGYLRCIGEVCVVPPAITGEHSEDTPVVVFRSDKGAETAEISRFYVELAVSNLEQQRGLMYRRTMQPEWGMLFVYPYEEHHAFWMKNTLIPLDMVFVDGAGQVVGIVEAAAPLTLDRREVDGASRYVLELNAGVAGQSGIRKGVWMSFENIAIEHQPR